MKYVIIGNSTAGIGAVEGIRQLDRKGGIVIITNEPHHTYSRPLISYLLLGKITKDKIKYRDENFYKDNNAELIYGEAIGIDNKNKQVRLAGNRFISYDKLLVAAGSSAFAPPFEGLDGVGCKHNFMTLDDAENLNAAADKNKRVLIIGAGLIGLKCAEGIKNKVASVTILDMAPGILSSILDTEGAKIVQSHLENKGFEFKLGCGVKYFDKNSAVLENGERLDFDILVLAVGVRPNIGLLNGKAEILRGILVNESSETSVPGIYAAGDCTQIKGQDKIMALLPNAYMQGECAGINMAGGKKSLDKLIPMNAIGFFGLHIITAGEYNGEIYREESAGSFKSLYYGDNKLNGYILIGDIEKAGIYTSLIREKRALDTLDFGLVCRKPGLIAFGAEYRKIKLGGV
ncbi:MAG: FAD-dependent oxidoreductase [Oscillospiraceae bacterium]|nr:FAD-dependent oxidoreductase [Oscillospiraceae bacterium]